MQGRQQDRRPILVRRGHRLVHPSALTVERGDGRRPPRRPATPGGRRPCGPPAGSPSRPGRARARRRPRRPRARRRLGDRRPPTLRSVVRGGSIVGSPARYRFGHNASIPARRYGRHGARIVGAERGPRPGVPVDHRRAGVRRSRGPGAPAGRTGRPGGGTDRCRPPRRSRSDPSPVSATATGHGRSGGAGRRRPAPSRWRIRGRLGRERDLAQDGRVGLRRAPDGDLGGHRAVARLSRCDRRRPSSRRSRSCGRACAVMPSRPVIVGAATSALTMASSVDSIVASNSRSMTTSPTARTSYVPVAGRIARRRRDPPAAGCPSRRR